MIDEEPTPDEITYECDESESICDAVVFAVAAVTGHDPAPRTVHGQPSQLSSDPQQLPPLYTAINPDALNAIFQTAESKPPATGRLQFSYAECDVTIHQDARITVSPRDTLSSSTR